MKDWTTDVKLTVSPDRTIAFNGHFGEYAIIAGDRTYHVTTRKGVTHYDAN